MEKIQVTSEISEALADELIQRLIGRTLTIVSFYIDSNHWQQPSVLKDVRMTGKFTATNGVVVIELEPRRSIKWDVKKEEVVVTYLDDDVVVIERKLAGAKVIQRVILAF